MSFFKAMAELQDAHANFKFDNPASETRLRQAIFKINDIQANFNRFSSDMGETFGPDFKTADRFSVRLPKIDLVTDINGKITKVEMKIGDKPVTFDGKTFGERMNILKDNVEGSFNKAKDFKTAVAEVSAEAKSLGRDIATKMGMPSLEDGISANLRSQSLSDLNTAKIDDINKGRLKTDMPQFTVEDIKSGAIKGIIPDAIGDTLQKAGVKNERIDNVKNDPGTVSELIDSATENAKTPAEKSFWEKLKSALKVLGLLGTITLAGLFSYEVLQYISKSRSGCIVSISDKNNNISNCKITSLTCNTDDQATTSLMPQCTDDIPSYITPQPTPSPSPCSGDKKQKCSGLCSSGYLVPKSSDGTKNYSYKCSDCDLMCAVTNIADGIVNAAVDAAKAAGDLGDGLAGFLNSIKAWIGYIILGIILLVVGFKIFGWFFSPSSGGHSFGNSRQFRLLKLKSK